MGEEDPEQYLASTGRSSKGFSAAQFGFKNRFDSELPSDMTIPGFQEENFYEPEARQPR